MSSFALLAQRTSHLFIPAINIDEAMYILLWWTQRQNSLRSFRIYRKLEEMLASPSVPCLTNVAFPPGAPSPSPAPQQDHCHARQGPSRLRRRAKRENWESYTKGNCISICSNCWKIQLKLLMPLYKPSPSCPSFPSSTTSSWWTLSWPSLWSCTVKA